MRYNGFFKKNHITVLRLGLHHAINIVRALGRATRTPPSSCSAYTMATLGCFTTARIMPLPHAQLTSCICFRSSPSATTCVARTTPLCSSCVLPSAPPPYLVELRYGLCRVFSSVLPVHLTLGSTAPTIYLTCQTQTKICCTPSVLFYLTS